MKKNNIFYACAAAALVFASCQKEVTPEVNDAPSTVLDVITATTLSTKTTTIDGVNVLWENGDQIGLWVGAGDRYVSAEYTANLDAATSSAEFVRTEDPAPGNYDGYYFALYPASSLNKWASSMEKPGTRRVYFDLPTSQTAVVGGWDKKSGILAATSKTTEFQFNHIVSYVKFTVDQSSTPFVSMTVTANKGESLAGVNIGVLYGESSAAYDPAYTSGTYSASVKISNEDGSVFAPGTYYVAVLPGTFAEGFTFTFENAEGLTAEKKIENSVAMEAGSVANMGTVGTLNFTAAPAKLEWASVYAENGVNVGVVYYIDPSNPYKGMIVSPGSATKLPWAISGFDGPAGCGADLNQNSVTNFNEIINEPNFSAENYPAAGYCYSLGEGWRLPSVEEIGVLFNSYYGKEYSTALKAGANTGGTDYRKDEAGIAAKAKFDAALGDVLAGDTIDALDPDDLGTFYWLDEEAKASGSSKGKNAYAARIGMYYYKNYAKTTEYRVRCIRDVEVK